MSAPPPGLAIILPSFNKDLRLPVRVAHISAYVRLGHRDPEIIFFDVGRPNPAADIAQSFSGEIPRLRVLSNGENRGKGYSVRHGMLEARGRLVLFTDADLSAPIDEADKLLHALENYDVAIGSRALDRSLISVHESRFREFAGIIFNLIV